MTYDPKQALRHFLKSTQPTVVPQGTPQASLVDAHGTPVIQTVRGADTVCFFLLAFANADPTLPDDFHIDGVEIDVEKPRGPQIGAYLRSHVRSDGAIYHGAFEAPHDKSSAVVVYGDPQMTEAQARAASVKYRQEFLAQVNAAMVAGHQAGEQAGRSVPPLTQDGVMTS